MSIQQIVDYKVEEETVEDPLTTPVQRWKKSGANFYKFLQLLVR